MTAALILLGVVALCMRPSKEWTTTTLKHKPYKPGNPYPY